jgi:HAD superfamily hydrolase (TIGR01484 family)
MVKIVFCDIDGCLGDFTKQRYPLRQEIRNNVAQLRDINQTIESFGKTLFGVSTGRSFYQSDNIMKITGCMGPSTFEMGNLVYEPNEGVYRLFDRHDKFQGYRHIINSFIEWKDKISQDEELVKSKFPNSDLELVKGRVCMLTYGFKNNIGKELTKFLFEIMPKELKIAFDKNLLTVLYSKNYIDMMPNLSKGDAVTYLLNKYQINKSEAMAIGDASHSDLDLLESVGIKACPDNADNFIKSYVLENGGFIVPFETSKGIMSILEVVKNHVKYGKLSNEQRNNK